MTKKNLALSGNRTPVSRVAGENSTTEPTMLKECEFSIIADLCDSNKYAFSRKLTTMGIEPTIFRFEVGRLIHWATRPMQKSKKECIMYDNTEMTIFVCLVASCAGSITCRYNMSNEGLAIDRHELSANKHDDRRRFVLIQVISARGKLRWPSG